MFNDDSLQLYDYFGSTDVDVVTNRIRYMVQALEVEWIILGHISILVSGLATHDERKLIDMAMTKLRTIVQELNIGMIVVSHLRRPDGDKGMKTERRSGLTSLGFTLSCTVERHLFVPRAQQRITRKHETGSGLEEPIYRRGRSRLHTSV